MSAAASHTEEGDAWKPLSGSKLRLLLSEVLGRRSPLKLPAADDLVDLAVLIDDARDAHRSDIKRGQMMALQDAAIEHVRCLTEILPELRDLLNSMSEQNDFAAYANEVWAGLDSTINEFLGSPYYGLLLGNLHPLVTGWHVYANTLASSFCAAMALSNPAVKIGMTDDGPLARFLERIIMMVSAETPSRAAVMQHLTRQIARERKAAAEHGDLFRKKRRRGGHQA